MSRILVQDIVLRCSPGTSDRTPELSALLIILRVDGQERLRTQHLVQTSPSSWELQNESLQIPLRGDRLVLEVTSEKSNGEFELLGHVELSSDELLAHCLQDNTTAHFDVIGVEGVPVMQLILNPVLIPEDVGLDFRDMLGGEAPSADPTPSDIDHDYAAALRLPDRDPEKWTSLMGIGTRFYDLFRLHQDYLSLAKSLQALEEGIGLVLDVVPPTQDQHQFVRQHTETYQTAMSEFVAAFREFNDDAIDCLSRMLRKSSVIFIMLYDRFSQREDLTKAISICAEARSLVSEHHPDRSAHLRRSGLAFSQRFRFSGNVEDIDGSISALEESVRLTPESDPDLPDKLTNLGTSYVLRAEYSRDMQDVNRAVKAHTRALTLREDHSLLHNLGTALLLRFIHRRDLTDAEVAVSAFTKAVKLIPENHPDMRRLLGNLGVAHHNRFEVLHDPEDIDNAIAMQQRAIGIINRTVGGHSEEATHYASLGNAYLSRVATVRLQSEDLHLAVEALKRAVELTPSGHAHLQKRRYNLGQAYLSRHKLLRDSTDVDLAISELDASLHLLPDGHSDKPTGLLGLGSAFQAKFEVSLSVEDIERAISLESDALHALDQNDPRRRTALSTLGNSYLSRFTGLKDSADLDEAIRRLEEAIGSTPDQEYAQKQICACQLADAYNRRFALSNKLEDLEAAIDDYRRAATTSHGAPWTSFLSATHWAHAVREHEKHDLSAALEAYSVAVDLLPRVASIGQPIAERHDQLVAVGGSLATEAVAAAIAAGQHNLAVEWLEQARGIVWGQQLHLRTSFDDLRAVAPDLAADLDRVSNELDSAGSRDVNPTTDLMGTARLEDAAKEHRRSGQAWLEWKELLPQLSGLTDLLESMGASMHYVISPEEIAQNQRRTAEEWDKLVSKARAISGFEDFLRPKTFSQILDSLTCSPVVVLNVDELRSDALVLMAGFDEAIHIPLPLFTSSDARRLHHFLRRSLDRSQFRGQSERAAHLVSVDSAGHGIQDILAESWTRVVNPVLDALAFSVTDVDEPPRIWWCPTGPLAFLPFHAAGIYTTDDPGSKLSDFAVSSYTPTLASLFHPPASPDFRGILCVSQSATLPNAEVEAEQITQLALDLEIDCCSLRDDEGTVQAVLDALEHYGWVHLACHGVQDMREPTKSAFVLHDWPLALSEIIAASFSHADFAFLSACQTATGAEDLPDEAAHLAAGMLAAGFRSVIATMWSILDADAPIVAKAVYHRLLSSVVTPNSSKAAWALHHALKQLKEQDKGKTFSWVPFIHVGM